MSVIQSVPFYQGIIIKTSPLYLVSTSGLKIIFLAVQHKLMFGLLGITEGEKALEAMLIN
jgi:hypothetical protein